MFRGIYEISLDAKGRLSVPSKLRTILEEESDGQVVLTADLDKNLLIYLLSDWQKASAKLEKLSSIETRARNIKRLYLGHACDCELDTTGRILIPPMLRKFAGLDKKVVLTGMGNKLELWDQQRWDSQNTLAMEMLSAEDFDFGQSLEELSI
ncbi:division/cell wall cluster transcriptional repressor MraZ [Suttonella ornithocola]|uniref:Transcriptional regulator MraZ n=1 Tax=Suttonella ornithocola TaxID=279832 RepID=A0A380MYE5_9GAMM|nr:division/cell wall cluster transcriptional repressor MraZ [Suttonella ornithocola]SUO97244.1 cell division protein MraZ [Suttonella ornithocola]